jgi:hypothetical protein
MRGPLRWARSARALSSCPAQRGRGTARRAVEGASATPLVQSPHAPSTAQTRGPPPPLRFTTRWRTSERVPATRSAPGFCSPTKARSGLCEAIDRSPSRKRASGNKEREAERRKAHQPCPAPSLLFPPRVAREGWEGARARATEQVCTKRAQTVCFGRARLSALTLAALARTSERSSSAQAVLHATDKQRGRYPRRRSRLSGAPRAPVVMPAGAIPEPPGSGVTSPARRNRTRSVVRCVSRSRPLRARFFSYN